MPEIALRNLSGARRTGIGFRFCQGVGENVAHPVREPFWGEKNVLFQRKEWAAGRRGQCTAARLPAQTAAAEPLTTLLHAGVGDAEPTGTRRGPGHPKSVPSSRGTQP